MKIHFKSPPFSTCFMIALLLWFSTYYQLLSSRVLDLVVGGGGASVSASRSSWSVDKSESVRRHAKWERMYFNDEPVLLANGSLFLLGARLTMTYDDPDEGFFHIVFLSQHVFKRRIQEAEAYRNSNTTYYSTLNNLTLMEKLALRCRLDDDDDDFFDLTYLPEKHWDANVPDNHHTYEANLSRKLNKRELMKRWESGVRDVFVRVWLLRSGTAGIGDEEEKLIRLSIPLDSLATGRVGSRHASSWLRLLGEESVAPTTSYLEDAAAATENEITLCVRLTSLGRPYIYEWLHHHFKLGAKHVIIGYHPSRKEENDTLREGEMMDFARYMKPLLERGLVSIANVGLRPVAKTWTYNLINVFFDNTGGLVVVAVVRDEKNERLMNEHCRMFVYCKRYDKIRWNMGLG